MEIKSTAPTKANLIAAKDHLSLLQGGLDILDKSRKALIQAHDSKIKQRDDLNEEVNETIEKVSKNFKRAMITMGESKLDDISRIVPVDNSISLQEDEFMQTKIYNINFEPSKLNLSYSFYETNEAFDVALLSFNELKDKIYKLAELDTTINNLDRQIKKTSKKVNSLEKVQIPKTEERIKTISALIEEKEREEFSKTKMVKDKKIRDQKNAAD
ncbi:MAG: V-type ATP synthase subunit D [Anaerococcus sp.]|uniref:V-type ATP synthase subunit D n=1 Tax=Anaerococcus nagyae TaxID=1755241 RepID=A0A3E2TIH0_9FIRM|nr:MULTISPECIES: V-type ATP synthase subunit D [Anaerococcus]MBP2069612.1 V/A-type H+-transporting ATPase subunit D [Anaerococcus nagyae]MDU1828430.1 V-type ATP synthase subunit D [Anaerococcus sp.]MDU1864747.1 V-type ATP synthase subunit D [Anaerococcus sp.]MDU2353681.1 V-type ATP synthase subunit D [Anaerococcus sp.]MDU3211183.1 V-type ATP synthase subunit D [Anaerococcus sp.]